MMFITCMPGIKPRPLEQLMTNVNNVIRCSFTELHASVHHTKTRMLWLQKNTHVKPRSYRFNTEKYNDNIPSGCIRCKRLTKKNQRTKIPAHIKQSQKKGQEEYNSVHSLSKNPLATHEAGENVIQSDKKPVRSNKTNVNIIQCSIMLKSKRRHSKKKQNTYEPSNVAFTVNTIGTYTNGNLHKSLGDGVTPQRL